MKLYKRFYHHLRVFSHSSNSEVLGNNDNGKRKIHIHSECNVIVVVTSPIPIQGPHKDGWHATRQFYEWVYATRQFQAIPIVVKN
jgi:hypothetical protein